MKCRTERTFGLVVGILVLVVAGGTPVVRAGGGPENVAVVVNADSWASTTIANEYVHLRSIPPSNVVYLTGLKSFQTIDVESFRETILLPVFRTLYERGVFNHIDCVTYSADLPTAIDVKADFADAKLAKYQTTVGSINGLTYLYKLVLAKRPEYLRLDVNQYMRRPLLSVNSVPNNPEDIAALQKIAQLLEAKQWEAARRIMQPMAARLTSNAGLQYNLACCLALLDQDKEAMDALTQAVLAGWSDRAHAEADTDLLTLRTLPVFKVLLAKMDENKAKPFDVQPTTAFSSQQQWNLRGDKVESQGIQYMLSTVLAVTSGRGNSVNEALTAMRRSVSADATRPEGTVYFMENSDVRAKTRQPAFVSAAAALQGTGVTGRIETGVLPERKRDVAGAMIGSANFDWQKSGSTILPGAICEHLTSFGGAMLETNAQTPLTEFIRYGAAGTSGTVTEPYSIQAKFPLAFMYVHYARGCSLAEAFYQSVFGPYQLLIIGDPLCQPWAERLEVQAGPLKPNQRVSGKIAIEPSVAGGAPAEAKVDHYELFIDGRRGTFDPQARSISLDTEQLGDGWHELSLVAVSQGELATRSRMLLPLIVDNGTGGVSLELADKSMRRVTYGDEFTVRAKSTVAARMEIASHGRVLGTIDGPDGTLRIDTRSLGIGPVRLQASTRLEDKPVFSAPVQLQVEPPRKMSADTRVNASQLKPGIALRVGRGGPTVIDSTKAATWLADQKPQAGESLRLDAFFSASSDDLYQFQFRGNAVSEILVDGRSQWQAVKSAAGAETWTMVPLQLAKGWHQFQLKGTVPETPRLEIRFGNQGCRSLDAGLFKYKQ